MKKHLICAASYLAAIVLGATWVIVVVGGNTEKYNTAQGWLFMALSFLMLVAGSWAKEHLP